MLITLAKNVNRVVQIVGRGIAFIIGIPLAFACWPLMKLGSLICTILWTIIFVPSWISSQLLMFALDMKPAECKREFEARERLEEIKKVVRQVRKERLAKEDEKTDEPS